jgi:hypothetical protein
MLRLRRRRKPLDEMTSQEVLELAARAVIHACPGVLCEAMGPNGGDHYPEEDASRALALSPWMRLCLPDGRRIKMRVLA